MNRTKLPERRLNETSKVTFMGTGGKEWPILITVGFDEEGRPKEVFSSSFKVGTDLNAIVSDACMVLSRLLQHDDDPADILAGMSQPYSLLGVIAEALTKIERRPPYKYGAIIPREPGPSLFPQSSAAAEELVES